MFSVTPQGIITLIAVAAAAFLAVKLFFKLDDRQEQRRRVYAETGRILHGHGLTYAGEALTDLAIGDYSGAMQKLKSFYDLSLKPAELRAHLRGVAQTMVPKLIDDDPEFASQIRRIVDNKIRVEEAERAAVAENARLNEQASLQRAKTQIAASQAADKVGS